MSTRQAYDVPGTHDKVAYLPAKAAADASADIPVFEAPVNAKIEKVKIIPGAGVTGQATNTRHINLINKGTDGAGATELANYDLIAGNNLAANDAFELYAPAAALEIAQGVVLAIQLEKIGTGLATPEMMVVVEFSPN